MFREIFIGRREYERKPASVVSFDMARHSNKTKLPDGREPISKEGMGAAVSAGQSSKHYETVVKKAEHGALQIDGSSRERTLQSGLLRMLAEHFKDVNFDNVDPQEIVKWIQEEISFEVNETDLLDFNIGDGVYKNESDKAYAKGEYFKWLVHSSDQLAIEEKLDPDQATPFSIQAGNVATYIFVTGMTKTHLPREEEKNATIFTTSHQGVLESFLYKVIQQKASPEILEQFIESHPGGFAENEGFKVDFKMYDINKNDYEVDVNFQGRNFILKPSDLIKIISEGYEFASKL